MVYGGFLLWYIPPMARRPLTLLEQLEKDARIEQRKLEQRNSRDTTTLDPSTSTGRTNIRKAELANALMFDPFEGSVFSKTRVGDNLVKASGVYKCFNCAETTLDGHINRVSNYGDNLAPRIIRWCEKCVKTMADNDREAYEARMSKHSRAAELIRPTVVEWTPAKINVEGAEPMNGYVLSVDGRKVFTAISSSPLQEAVSEANRKVITDALVSHLKFGNLT